MLRVLLTGTIATAATEQAAAHGLGTTPDVMYVSRRTNAAGLAPSAEAGDVGAINGFDIANIYAYCITANTFYTVLAAVWQGRSY